VTDDQKCWIDNVTLDDFKRLIHFHCYDNDLEPDGTLRQDDLAYRHVGFDLTNMMNLRGVSSDPRCLLLFPQQRAEADQRSWKVHSANHQNDSNEIHLKRYKPAQASLTIVS